MENLLVRTSRFQKWGVLAFFFCCLVQYSHQTPNYRRWFMGAPAHGVAAVYSASKMTGDAKCYGGIVSWWDVVVPCSCVVTPPSSAWTPWNHPAAQAVTPLNPGDLKVSLMAFERDDGKKQANSSEVEEIKIHPGCDSSFAVNLARLKVKTPIKGSRLLWVPTAVPAKMKKFIESVALATAVSGHCFALQWEFSNDTGKPEWNITTNIVNIQHWSFCDDYICPKYSPPSGTPHQNPHQCDNTIQIAGRNTSRWCITWDGFGPLCRFREGTPIMCSAGSLSGFIGVLSNTTLHCPIHYVNGIMQGIDLASEIVHEFPVKEWMKTWLQYSAAHPVSSTPDTVFPLLLSLLSLYFR